MFTVPDISSLQAEDRRGVTLSDPVECIPGIATCAVTVQEREDSSRQSVTLVRA